MIDLRQLEFAVALDQHRRFGRAADAMGVTQPTFSRGIAALEAALDTRLFDRSTRRVEPTPQGRAVLVLARRLLADASALRGALDDYQGLRSGRITIGAGAYPLELSIVEAVARLTSRHPRLQIEILEGQWREFGPKLLSGEVEVAVAESTIVAPDPRFQIELLAPHRGCFYGRRGHPLADRSHLTLADILEFPIVGVRLPARILPPPKRETIGLALDAITGDLLPHITTTSVAASRAVVKRSNGIGIAVPLQIAEDVRRGTLVILDAHVATMHTNYGVTWLRERSLSPAALAFVSELRQVEAEIAAASTGRGAAIVPRRHRGR